VFGYGHRAAERGNSTRCLLMAVEVLLPIGPAADARNNRTGTKVKLFDVSVGAIAHGGL
jgi:hypothetical protein